MYAMALESWGSKELVRVEMPTPEPRRGQVRVAVHAAGVNPVDWKMRSSGPLRLAARAIRPLRGPRGPIILGVDFAGVIEAVGSNVGDLVVGQRVVGGTDFSRGQHGSYADTVVVDASQVCALPDNVSFDDASTLPVAGVTAWMALTEFRPMTADRSALVLGASGGVGQFAVQIAKHSWNAAMVVGVCSGPNTALVRGLGADVAIDYKTGDALEQARAHGPFDVIVDCSGSYRASQCRSLLAPSGRHVMVAGDSPAAMLQIFVPPFRSRTILGRATRSRLGSVVDAVAGKHVTVNIAARMPLAEVEAAHRQSQTGRMTGKLVLLPRG